MTVVVSIRLDPMNSRERKALQILQAWNKKGYGNRYTIVEGLLNLEKEQPDDVIERIARIENLILDLKSGKLFDQDMQTSVGDNSDLTDEFKEAIKINLRKGMAKKS